MVIWIFWERPEILRHAFRFFWPFRGCGGACGLCPKSRAWCARHAFRGLSCREASLTLLVVSILDMIAICSKFCSSEGVNECFILGIKYCEKHDVIIKLTILGYASAQVFLSRCYNQFTKQTSLGEESFCSLTS